MKNLECDFCQADYGMCTECGGCFGEHCYCSPCAHGKLRTEDCVFCSREVAGGQDKLANLFPEV